ncbi:hypothetical protein [Caulobacter sp. LARHSG274]
MQTTYVSRVSVAVTEDMTILCTVGPGGPVTDGAIQATEAGRFVMTHKTMRDLAKILAEHVAQLDDREKALLSERRTIEAGAGQERRPLQ